METILTKTYQYRVDTEQEAIDLINRERNKALESGYTITKANYAYKTKKKGGEIVAEGYLVSVTREYESFWAEFEEASKDE